MKRPTSQGRPVSQAGRLNAPWTGLTALLALALIALLAVSGAAMSFYYSPAPGAAWDSVDYAQFKLPFGEVLRGVHGYAANLLLIVLLVHLFRIFLVGAYKTPGHKAWISLVLVVLLVPAFFVTGDLLPWNQVGYWSTQVRLSVVASVPVVGDAVAGVLRGGQHIGVLTLTRFYVVHILFLPLLLMVLLLVHGTFVARDTVAHPSVDRHRDLLAAGLALTNRCLLVFLLIGLALALAAWQIPFPLGDPADPTDTSYIPRPEWWALVLNQLVTIFVGPWAILGTVVIPGLLVALLLTLPFIDRSPERDPANRKPAMLAAAGIAALLLSLSGLGYATHYLAPPAESQRTAESR